jgi:hypothetical protein
MNQTITVERQFHVRHGQRARKELHAGTAQVSPRLGRIPRVSRQMALAIRFDELVRAGRVADYAEIARLGHVTRARITQIMNLLMLAPDIQEEILFLPRVEVGSDPIHLRQLQSVAAVPDWRTQRRLWRQLIPPSTNSKVEPGTDSTHQ